MEEKFEDFERFKLFLEINIKEIDENSLKGIRYIKGALTSVFLDVLRIFTKTEKLAINKQASEDYIKHIKRSYIFEVWHLTENRIREIQQEKNIICKSANQEIRKMIERAEKFINNETAKTLLCKIKKKLSGGFIEFKRILNAVLRNDISDKERKEWNKFFEIFREIRNASHNNFVAKKTLSMKSKWYDKDFEEGKSISIHVDELITILKTIFEFFRLVEK